MKHRFNCTGRLLGLALTVTLLAGCQDGFQGAMAPSRSAGAGEAGRNVSVAGTGLLFQPAILALTVPVSDSADILDARLRWAGRSTRSTGDDTIVINGAEHVATLLDSFEVVGDLPWIFFYELDVTALVRPGSNLMFVSGVDLDTTGPELAASASTSTAMISSRLAGIGAFVTYADPTSPWTVVHMVDPQEFVHFGTPGFETGSVWSFPIGMSAAERSGHFVLFAGDCQIFGTDEIWWGTGTGTPPASIVGAAPNVEIGALRSSLGDRMDVFLQDVVIPGGASRFDYQVASPAGEGDEILHFFGALLTDGDPPCVGAVSGSVWLDANGDGVRDAGEPALADIPVTLNDDLGAPIATTTTNVAGDFRFDGVCAGNYAVEVDESALSGFMQTTCGTGSCSPEAIVLVTDDSLVDGLAFGWSNPSSPGCLLSLGQWKHQLSIALGVNGGPATVPADELEALLAIVQATTALDWSGGDGVLDFADADALLAIPGGASSCERTETHYLVMLLDYAWNGAVAGQQVDTTGDGNTDMTFGEAIELCESLMADPSDGAACKDAKKIAKSISAMPSPDCGP